MSISSLIDMPYEGHEAVPPRSFDEWTDAAFDCLQRYCERGIPGSSLATKMVEKPFTDQDSNRLQALVAKFETAIQAHSKNGIYENFSKSGIYVKRQLEREIERIESYSIQIAYKLISSRAE
jgi:hypothetical protein